MLTDCANGCVYTISPFSALIYDCQQLRDKVSFSFSDSERDSISMLPFLYRHRGRYSYFCFTAPRRVALCERPDYKDPCMKAILLRRYFIYEKKNCSCVRVISDTFSTSKPDFPKLSSLNFEGAYNEEKSPVCTRREMKNCTAHTRRQGKVANNLRSEVLRIRPSMKNCPSV